MKTNIKRVTLLILIGIVLFGVLSIFSYGHNRGYRYSENRGLYHSESNWLNRRYTNGFGNGMCGYFDRNEYFGTNEEIDLEKISYDEMQSSVIDYIDRYKGDMKIQDVLEITDEQYIFFIKDDTKYAMELIVDPFTSKVYMAMGASYMWNTEYGNGNFHIDNDIIEISEAKKYADKYLEYTKLDYSLDEAGLDFYGYYKFYVKDEDEVVGYVDVNQYTGDSRGFILNKGSINFR
jgi:hypothetical protein